MRLTSTWNIKSQQELQLDYCRYW